MDDRIYEAHAIDGQMLTQGADVPHTHVVLVKAGGRWQAASWHYSPVFALRAAAAYEGDWDAVLVQPVNHGRSPD